MSTQTSGQSEAVTEGVRLTLKVRPSSRVAAFLGAIFVGFLALVWLLILMAIGGSEDPSLGLRLAWGFVAILLGLTLWGAWMALRESFRRPHIMVGPNEVTLSNSGVLRRPVHIPIGDVLAVAIDTPESPGLWAPDDLPVEIQYERGPITWTAGRDENIAATNDLTRLFVPLLDRDPQLASNLALVLKEPTDISRVKRSTFSSGGFHKTVIGTKTTQGFLACVRDTEAAEDVFGRLGLVRKLDSQDRELLKPREEDFRRFRRAHHVLAFSIAYGILVVAEQIWHAIRD